MVNFYMKILIHKLYVFALIIFPIFFYFKYPIKRMSAHYWFSLSDPHVTNLHSAEI